MDRWHTIKVVAIAAAAWAFAVAAGVFGAPHPVTIIASNVASVASVWVIARMSVDKIHVHIIEHTSNPVRKLDG